MGTQLSASPHHSLTVLGEERRTKGYGRGPRALAEPLLAPGPGPLARVTIGVHLASGDIFVAFFVFLFFFVFVSWVSYVIVFFAMHVPEL